MNPIEFEHYVADVLRREGWAAVVTPAAGDGGVDVLADRGGVRMGVQAKMYGTGRRINAQVVQQLFGAATCEGCTAFLIATDGTLTPEAHRTAEKLGVHIRVLVVPPRQKQRSSRRELDFAAVWDEHVAALTGTTLRREDGSTNEILSVDGGGLVRTTSGGTRQSLDIELFRWTIERLLAGEAVTRKDINERSIKRGSSGVMLILAATGLFETTKVGRLDALKVSAA